MSQHKTHHVSAQDIGFDRRNGRLRPTTEAGRESAAVMRNIVDYERSRFAMWDRYLRTVIGSDDALRVLERIKQET